LFGLVGASLAWTAEEARAADEAAAAESLFRQGLADMQAGKLDTACPALGESHRLDPRPGTLFTLAECEAKAGKVASAVAHYQDYLALVQRLGPNPRGVQNERERVAREQRDRLLPRVPRLRVVLPASAPGGTTVFRNEMELKPPSIGVSLPVDPGTHKLTTKAPDGPPHSVDLTIGEGEEKTIELQVAPPDPTWTPRAPYVITKTIRTTRPASWRRSAGFAALGVGAAGLTTGAIAGVLVLRKKSVVDRECDGGLCSAEGKTAADTGKQVGMVSTIAFAVGVAGAAAGITLLVLDRRESAPAEPVLSVGVGPAAVHLAGSF
jgi:hypothetical protein